MKVTNKIQSIIWDNLDFLIRFLYCRNVYISKKLFWFLYRTDIKIVNRQFENMYKILNMYNFLMRNSKVLELGPGNSNIMAYNFLIRGAKKVILVDKFPRQTITKKQKRYWKDEIEFIKRKYKKDLFFINNYSPMMKYISYYPEELGKLKMSQVDLIYSNSVLEHIKDVEKNVKAMYKVLKPNGYMYHNIDLRDHYNLNKPFAFYKYSDYIWNKYMTREGVSYTNRLRCDDYLRIFEKYKFKVLYRNKKRQNLGRTKLSSTFKIKEKKCLEVTNLSILIKKV